MTVKSEMKIAQDHAIMNLRMTAEQRFEMTIKPLVDWFVQGRKERISAEDLANEPVCAGRLNFGFVINVGDEPSLVLEALRDIKAQIEDYAKENELLVLGSCIGLADLEQEEREASNADPVTAVGDDVVAFNILKFEVGTVNPSIAQLDEDGDILLTHVVAKASQPRRVNPAEMLERLFSGE